MNNEQYEETNEQPIKIDVNPAVGNPTQEATKLSSHRRGGGFMSFLMPLVWSLVLGIILVAGAYFRYTGMEWDQGQGLHPDERFLGLVLSAVQPVDNVADYFNTDISSLNPHNRGYGFYVYGTLPLFIVRYLGEWLGESGFADLSLVGRYVSATLDLGTVLLVFLIAMKLYKKPWLALMAAALSAFSVLPIQLSHFNTVDTYANFFTTLAFLFAAHVLKDEPKRGEGLGDWYWIKESWSGVLNYLLFGVAVGLSMASKISAAPIAALLPAAILLVYFRLEKNDRGYFLPVFFRNLVLGGLVALVVFRIFQPYAFSGPGFVSGLNDKWVQNLTELSLQTGGDVDFPPALQWARRSITFSWENMVIWGLGLPLGLMASVGFLMMGWRMLKGEFKMHALLWGWTGAYFIWQSINFTRSMRYQLPIYPMVAIVAAWGVFALWQHRAETRSWLGRILRIIQRPLVAVLGSAVLVGTFLWAYAFIQIYIRPVTRLEASYWLYQNVPAAINLKVETQNGVTNRLVGYNDTYTITPEAPYWTNFSLIEDAALSAIIVNNATYQYTENGPDPVRIGVRILDAENSNQEVGFGQFLIGSGQFNSRYEVPLDALALLKADHRYSMRFEVLDAVGKASFTSAPALKLNRDYVDMSVFVPEQEVLNDGTITIPFNAQENGALRQVVLPVRFDDHPGTRTYSLTVQDIDGNVRGVSGFSYDPLTAAGGLPAARFEPPVNLEKGGEYFLIVQTILTDQRSWLGGEVRFLQYGSSYEFLLSTPTALIRSNTPYEATFVPAETGRVSEITLAHFAQEDFSVTGDQAVLFQVLDTSNNNAVIGEARLKADLRPWRGSSYGQEYTIQFNQAFNIQSGIMYRIRILNEGDGVLAIRGSAPAHESSWDDGLPMRVGGYDAYGGIYQRDLNFEMYWDDNADKLQRFLNNLNNADYIFITSNRQWGTTIRVPERYPLTTAYYQALIGCPEGLSIFWCYAEAEPGMFEGQLGFELVKVFQSEPNLGDLRFNSQFAEEAFSVYDHPKVLIFKKRADFDLRKASEILSAVDLSNVIHLTPLRATNYKGDLLLTDERAEEQRLEGTWSELFDRNALQNRSDFFAVVLWYLTISLLGWIVYPFVRLALGGLADHGYPFIRLVGMLLLALITWWAGSLGVEFNAGNILIFAGILALINLILFWIQRRSIILEFRSRWKYLLVVEGITLAFFLLFLFVRLNNPDLWHPYKGGEKPMDFSYFNAVLKSTAFPPYDPWFAGGYINYYYYGFVLVGVPVKMLGIIPAIAYNLIIPTFFSFLCMGFFSVVWNLVSSWQNKPTPLDALEQGKIPEDNPEEIGSPEVSPEREEGAGLPPPVLMVSAPRLAKSGQINSRVLKMSVFAAVIACIFGNFGVTGMFWLGLQRLSASQEQVTNAGFFERFAWTFDGASKWLSGTPLPYPPGEWYWQPSRVIPDTTINEFPAFTFLYADLHAHMMALPVTLLAVAWVISILRGRWKWGKTSSDEEYEEDSSHQPALQKKLFHYAASLLLAGVTIGALQPMNTWDLPTYMALGVLTILYTVIRYSSKADNILPGVNSSLKRWLLALVSIALLIGVAIVLYTPFNRWYTQGYGTLKAWDGPHTPLWSYITHWGLFLIILGFWMVWEIRDWMDKTPLSRLYRYRPYRWLILGSVIVAFLGWIVLVTMFNLQIFFFAVPYGLMAAFLIFRADQPDSKRLILFMIGTALLLTILVEVIVLEGDIGRMNTVFKFYLQAWTMLAIGSGTALYWMLPDIREKFSAGWRRTWKVLYYFFLFSAALFPLVAGMDKMTDRVSFNAPKSLDGMAYMNTSYYADFDQTMDLSQDYRAILWMQDNIQGTPVIVEANIPEYRWGTRYTIYTGLPGVIGWNWHQRQQRGVVSGEWVTKRVEQVQQFYTTMSKQTTKDFLNTYNVEYIIVGQLERGAYRGDGLNKFEDWNGELWEDVYRDGDTVIYQVIPLEGEMRP